jgi:hypothetical protein
MTPNAKIGEETKDRLQFQDEERKQKWGPSPWHGSAIRNSPLRKTFQGVGFLGLLIA